MNIIIPSDKTIRLDCDVVDDNLNDLSVFINKHNKYSIYEAVEILKKEIELAKHGRHQPISRYYRTPKYLRALLLFFYKYVFNLGFFDGREGFLYNFFQCLCYRMLCDAKADEILSNCGKDRNRIHQYLSENYNIEY